MLAPPVGGWQRRLRTVSVSLCVHPLPRFEFAAGRLLFPLHAIIPVVQPLRNTPPRRPDLFPTLNLLPSRSCSRRQCPTVAAPSHPPPPKAPIPPAFRIARLNSPAVRWPTFIFTSRAIASTSSPCFRTSSCSVACSPLDVNRGTGPARPSDSRSNADNERDEPDCPPIRQPARAATH